MAKKYLRAITKRAQSLQFFPSLKWDVLILINNMGNIIKILTLTSIRENPIFHFSIAADVRLFISASERNKLNRSDLILRCELRR